MFHCHNLIHEDNDMLRAFSVTARGPGRISAPFVRLTRQSGQLIYNNWGFNNPLFGQTNARLTRLWEPFSRRYTQIQV
jgi:hypothetical protein